jgi:hypothetical protein
MFHHNGAANGRTPVAQSPSLEDAWCYFSETQGLGIVYGFMPRDPIAIDGFNLALATWRANDQLPQFYQIYAHDGIPREPLFRNGQPIPCGVMVGENAGVDMVDESGDQAALRMWVMWVDENPMIWRVDIGNDSDTAYPITAVNAMLMEFYHREADGNMPRQDLGIYVVTNDARQMLALVVCPIGLVEPTEPQLDETKAMKWRQGILRGFYGDVLKEIEAVTVLNTQTNQPSGGNS